MDNYFVKLNCINVSDKTEKKGNLTYLSWAWAWGEVKKAFPDATFTVYENAQGWNYHTDGRTAWVKTGVTINGIEHIEYLPVMDNRNQSIPLERVTSRNVNDSIQRSITKACARHGLGLYIYAGEDLPDIPKDEQDEPQEFHPASQAQKNTIRTKCQPVQWASMKQKYGENLERLSREKAGEALAKLKEQEKEKRENARDQGIVQALYNEDAGDRV